MLLLTDVMVEKVKKSENSDILREKRKQQVVSRGSVLGKTS